MREDIIKQLDSLSETQLTELINFVSTPSEGKMYTILTKAGLAAQANAAISKEKVDFYEMAVGDGNGTYPDLSEDMTELVNETWRGKINHVRVYDESNNHINISTVLPPDTGDQFNIREVGLFDKKGNMLAVGRYPLTWKPSISNGAVKELTINMVLLISNVANIVLKIDPTVIHASLKDLEDLRSEIQVDYNDKLSKIQSNLEDTNLNLDKVSINKLDIKHDKNIFEEERHGLRVKNSNFQFYDGYEWKEITVDQLKIRDSSNLPLRTQVSNIEPPAEDGRIYYNPKTKLFYVARDNQWYRLFAGGDEKLERKAPSAAPKLKSKTDTTISLVDNNNMEFRYQGGSWRSSSSFSGLQRNETYKFEQRYKADDVYKSSPPSPVLSVTTNKGTQTSPSAPKFSNLAFNKVTITGETNTEVRINSGTWYSSPHTFTLKEKTEYTAYARKKESNTHSASPQSNGTKFKTPAESFLYGFEVDETNSNSSTAVTYIGNNANFTPMSVTSAGNVKYGSWEKFIKKISYRVVVKFGVERYKVQYDDPTKKLDGSDANLTGTDGDLFTKIVPIWRKYSKTSKGYRIELSDKPFLGAKSLVAELENGYNQFNYPTLLLLQDLYLLLFKDRDSQRAIGRGQVSDSNFFAKTGGTNGKGYIYGLYGKDDSDDKQMCFLGIEDLWFSKRIFLDGIVMDGNGNLHLGTKDFDDYAKDYTMCKEKIYNDINGYPKKILDGYIGYLPGDNDASSSTGYCDYSSLVTGRWQVATCGNSGTRDSSGIFSINFNTNNRYSSDVYVSRLCFKNSEGIYVGNYLGYINSGDLKSISDKTPTGNKTIVEFRTAAQNNN